MTCEKWKLVGGRVYRLAEVFDNMLDAVSLAREMKKSDHVFLSKTKDNQWAVYWRARRPQIQCEAKYYSV
ncbi:MAG: hypothetical protein JW779_10200 [Candidatus Thorarchaeota archaeon]|nr:hypothetical protein [Candidatus Thorarchaeota archaeon]